MTFNLVVLVDGVLFGTDLFGRVWERRVRGDVVEWVVYSGEVRVLR